MYDAAGRVASSFELADLGPNGLPEPRPSLLSNDTWRETVTHRDPLGRVSFTQYVFDHTFTETRYDPNGNAIWRRSRTRYTSWNSTTNQPTIDTADVSVITRVGFDRLNRAVKTCVGDGPDLSEPPGTLTGWEAGCTWTHFDDAGRVNWRLDERGALSITELDGMGRAERTCGPFFPALMPGDDDPLTCAGQPVTRSRFSRHGGGSRRP